MFYFGFRFYFYGIQVDYNMLQDNSTYIQVNMNEGTAQ